MRPHAVSCPPTTDQQEQLPCPRCDSTNTKFCYYNNYNFSQPRHFCKSCRRYWTHGGTLRDIPIGGGSRKPAKRSRTSSSSTRTPPSSLSNGTTPLDTDAKGSALSLCGTFTSLLNANATPTPTHGSASVIGLGGIGLGSAFDDLSFGLGRPVWPFSTLPDATTTNAGPIPATWQFEGLESNAGGFVSADYFAWPDLSITTPGNSLK